MERIEIKNQADNLIYSYENTLKENANAIAEDMKALAGEKLALLKAAMGEPNIAIKELQQCLDQFQQTLFAVGANVYSRASNSSEDMEYAEVPDVDHSVIEEEMQGDDEDAPAQFTFDFDEDNTLHADYEAID